MKYIGTTIKFDKKIIANIQKLIKNKGNTIQLCVSYFLPKVVKTSLLVKSPYPKKTGDMEKIIKNIKSITKKNNIKIFIHSHFAINLANDWTINSWWIIDLLFMVNLAHKINADGIIIHTGRSSQRNKKKALQNMYTSLMYILTFIEKYNAKSKQYTNIKIFLETSAGVQYKTSSKEELLSDLAAFAKFCHKFKHYLKNDQLKICVDTCHIFAAGYDIRTKQKIKKFLKYINKIIGIKYIGLIHLNDSKNNLNSHIDRHESLGKGKIGLKNLLYFCNFFSNVPIILETPEKYHKKELKLIKFIHLFKSGFLYAS